MRSPWPTGPSSTTPTSTPTVRNTTRAPRHLILRPDFVILKYVAASHGIYADDLLTARSRAADRPAHRCSAGRANPGLENCYGRESHRGFESHTLRPDQLEHR